MNIIQKCNECLNAINSECSPVCNLVLNWKVTISIVIVTAIILYFIVKNMLRSNEYDWGRIDPNRKEDFDRIAGSKIKFRRDGE